LHPGSHYDGSDWPLPLISTVLSPDLQEITPLNWDNSMFEPKNQCWLSYPSLCVKTAGFTVVIEGGMGEGLPWRTSNLKCV